MDKFVFPVDFIILDFEANIKVPIILGRPFLAIGRILIDVQKGELTMRVNDQEVTFNVFKALKYSNEGTKDCSFVRTIDSLVQKQLRNDQEYFEKELVDFDDEKLIGKEKIELVEEQHEAPRWTRKFESLDLTNTYFKDNVPSIEKPPKLELKQLSSHLKYVYLGDQETLPVIISAQLTLLQDEDLIMALKKHKKAIGWQMADIKGISPTLYA